MSVLCWGPKPKKIRSTEAHNAKYSADCAPPGTYVPNMSREDNQSWKAKKIGGFDQRVEIRFATTAQVVLIVTKKSIQFSSNGKALISIGKLLSAIEEARACLDDPPEDVACARLKQWADEEMNFGKPKTRYVDIVEADDRLVELYDGEPDPYGD